MVIQRFLARRALSRRRKGYHSRFGGLWTDRLDALEGLEQRKERHAINEAEAGLLEKWIQDGYVVVPGGVPRLDCDRLLQKAERSWSAGDPDLVVEVDREDGPIRVPLDPRYRSERTKVLDLHAVWPEARSISFAPVVAAFLRLVFEDSPVAFQSLLFERGTQQDIHQDTAYVVVRSPMELVGVWVALEDIQEGSGELRYYKGSHRFEERCFGRPAARNWNPEKHGEEVHREYLAHLHEQARERGSKLETFRPRKGDVLFWSADLAHGGGPVTQPDSSRWSLVTHYCPRRTEPYWFSYKPGHRTMIEEPSRCFTVSSHYKLG